MSESYHLDLEATFNVVWLINPRHIGRGFFEIGEIEATRLNERFDLLVTRDLRFWIRTKSCDLIRVTGIYPDVREALVLDQHVLPPETQSVIGNGSTDTLSHTKFLKQVLLPLLVT